MQPMRLLWTLLATLALGLTASAQGDAQGKVQAQLFTRSADGAIEAVLKIELAEHWHIYHTELGHDEAVGLPTTFKFGGEGITWGEPVLPEPDRIDQSAFGKGVFILAHEGSLVVRVTGTLAQGATGEDAMVSLRGQVCDPSVCLLFGFDVKTSGSGSDALFGGSSPSSGGSTIDEEPAPSEDNIERGRADATLYTRVVGDEVQAAIAISIQRGYHLYGEELGHPEAAAEPTTIALKGAGVEWGPVHYPEAHRQGQGFDASDGSGEEVWTWAYEGDVVFHMRGKLTGEVGDLWGVVEGQTCDDNGCIPYKETVVSKGKGPDDYFAYFASSAGNETSVTNATGNEPAREKEEQPLGAFLLVCIGGGLFTLLMPCTYPMIPITISFFTKQADKRGGKILPLSLAYGAGIVLIFVAIGAIVGPTIVKFATHWVTNLVIGTAFLYFALVLFGIINLQPPRFLMKLAGGAQGGSGLGGVFLMGATLVITSFTCTAPIVGAILGAGASGGDLSRVIMGMAVFGLTMAVPFVILSLIPGRMASIPSAGQWMNTIKFFLGFVEVAASMKFFSNMDVAINEGPKWLPYGPFMWAWVAIFVVAGLYLLGVLRFKDPKGRPEPLRMAIGILTLLFAAYLGFSAQRGFATGTVMTALAPPVHMETNWVVIEDDYDAARAQAQAEGKLLLVNFTGHT